MPPHLLRHARPRRAFALFVVLILVGLSAACAFSLIAISATRDRENQNRLSAQSARSAALAGTLIALGNLQTYTGTDACATAELGRPLHGDSSEKWTCAWHGRRIAAEFSEYAPLVSNRGIFAERQFCTLRNFSKTEESVEVPWEKIGENARIAFFITDESQFASLKKRERDAHLDRFSDDPETLARLRQQLPRRTNLELFFGECEPDDPKFRAKIESADDEKIFLSKFRENLTDSRLRAAQKSLTSESLGVPANWQKCELKTDFSDETAADDLVPPETLARFRETENPFPPTGTPVATSPPKTAGTSEFFSHPFPLIAELKLHLGFFNPRSDGQHRVRFHVTARVWNPYTFPLLARGDGRLGLFDAKNLPLILIRNENTGGEISVSPTDFPVGRFGLVRQTPSDQTCNAYLRIFDASAQGLGEDGNAAGLHAGEVFLARFPDPRGQPEGLARNTGGASWKYQKTLANIAKPPSGAKPDAWFHPLHKIRIQSLPTFLPVSFLIRGDAGSLPQSMFPEDYADPVFEFRNVFLPLFSLTISGEEYNRAKAGDYDISQASLVWKIRLRAEDSAAMDALFAAVDPRAGIFDFSVPAVARAFEVSTLAGTDAAKEAEIGGAAESFARNPSPLRDRFPNEHASSQEDAFACVRIFDAPRSPALSVGALRHCAFGAFPPHATFGDPATRTRKISPNAIFDRAFFSAKNFSDESPNPHFVPAKNRNRAEERRLISGVFNINSENAEAWAAKLPHNVPDWQQFSYVAAKKKTVPVSEKKQLRAAFFTHPFSAQIPAAGTKKSVYTDEELERLEPETRAKAFAEQNLRELRPDALTRFSEAIVREIRERRTSGYSPFRSLEEFADSGILNKALSKSTLNVIAKTPIPAWYPSAISQRAILESFAPCAAPRGDTFTIVCRAETFHPITKKATGAACAKLRVQRMPEFFDDSQAPETPFTEQNALNRAFGRRYKIISFQWLPHDAH